VISLLAFAILMPLVLVTPAVAATAVFIVAGLLSGMGAGPIMALPAQILKPANRGFGMGIFRTIYYAMMMAGPAFAGQTAERTGHASTAFMFGVTLAVISIGMIVLFRFQNPEPTAAAATGA
jgi:MFS family permease